MTVKHQCANDIGRDKSRYGSMGDLCRENGNQGNVQDVVSKFVNILPIAHRAAARIFCLQLQQH
jgi:hypothetical protein